jgi:hypothetical protein
VLLAGTVLVGLVELLTYLAAVVVVGWLWPSLAAAGVATAEWFVFFGLVAKFDDAEAQERQRRGTPRRRPGRRTHQQA